MDDGVDRIKNIEQEAALRFVQWDPKLWRRILDGPAQVLSEMLVERGGDVAAGAAAVESWLRLCAQGIGHGYLVPAAELGVSNFFTLAFTELVPLLLPSLPPERWGDALARCWNLGENLEASPPWLRRLFLREASALESLDGLESLVARVAALAQDAPARPVGEHPRLRWIHLGADDWRFLPGAVHFVAPRIACVHDRHRAGEEGRPPVTLGVLLADGAPEILGPMGCSAPSPSPGATADPLLARAARLDTGVTDVHAVARNAWHLVATLVTSQHLLALHAPEGGA